MEKDVDFKKGNGFEKLEFEHNALPEIAFDDIDTAITFLGKKFTSPLFIEAMTGGHPEAEKINKNLAKAAEELGYAQSSITSHIQAIEDYYEKPLFNRISKRIEITQFVMEKCS